MIRLRQRYIQKVLCFAALYLCMALFAQGQETSLQLKSTEELKEKFAFGELSKAFNGKQYFLGSPKLNERYGQPRPKREIYCLTSSTLTVTPLMSDEQYQKVLAGYILIDFAASPTGKSLFLLRCKNMPDNGIAHGLVRVDPATGDGEVLVDEGTYLYNYTISPSGRYLAFYSSDHMLLTDMSSMPFINAGKILDLATKTVKTVIQPARYNDQWQMYIPPAWLDNERVVMNGLVTNPELLKQQPNRPFKEQACCYVAVVNAASDQIIKFFMPLGFHYVEFHVLQNSLILNNERQAIRTDWDLVPQEEIVSVREDQMLRFDVKGGKVDYDVGDRVHH